MSFSVVQNRIRLVRGDSAEIRLVICDRVTGEPFIPGKRDELTFTLKRSFTDERPVLTKTLERASGRKGRRASWFSGRTIPGTFPAAVISMMWSWCGRTDTPIPLFRPGLFSWKGA